MKFGYSIDEHRGMILLEFSGSFDCDRFIASIKQLWADPAYRREYEGIADISTVENTYTMADLYRVIGFLRKNPLTNTSRWAVITASPLAVASAYVYQKAMAPVHHLDVFSTWESACAFLQKDVMRPAFFDHVTV